MVLHLLSDFLVPFGVELIAVDFAATLFSGGFISIYFNSIGIFVEDSSSSCVGEAATSTACFNNH